jgi:hypothetical protein
MKAIWDFFSQIFMRGCLFFGLILMLAIVGIVATLFTVPLTREDADPGETSVDEWLERYQWLWEGKEAVYAAFA